MSFEVSTIDWPILVIRPGREVDQLQWESGWADVSRCIRGRSGAFGLLPDARLVRPPSALKRRVVAEFFREHAELIEERCVGISIVTNNPVVRAAATAVFWIASPPAPVQFFKELDVATAWLNDRLERGRLT